MTRWCGEDWQAMYQMAEVLCAAALGRCSIIRAVSGRRISGGFRRRRPLILKRSLSLGRRFIARPNGLCDRLGDLVRVVGFDARLDSSKVRRQRMIPEHPIDPARE